MPSSSKLQKVQGRNNTEIFIKVYSVKDCVQSGYN